MCVVQRHDTTDTVRARGIAEFVTKIHVYMIEMNTCKKLLLLSAQLNRSVCVLSHLATHMYKLRAADDSVCIFNSNASISFVCSYIAQQQHTSSSLMRAILGMLVRS